MSGLSAFPKLLEVERTAESIKITALVPDGDTTLTRKMGHSGRYVWGQTILEWGCGFDKAGVITLLLKYDTGEIFPFCVYSDDVDKHLNQLKGIEPRLKPEAVNGSAA